MLTVRAHINLTESHTLVRLADVCPETPIVFYISESSTWLTSFKAWRQINIGPGSAVVLRHEFYRTKPECRSMFY